MASITEWNTAQRVAWRDTDTRSYGYREPPFSRIAELVVCTHSVKRNGENVTLMIYRIQLSDPARPPRTLGRSQRMRVRLGLLFGTNDSGGAATEPPDVLAWAPFKEPKRYKPSDLNDAFESNISEMLGAKAIGAAMLQLGSQKAYGYAMSSHRRFGSMPGTYWDFPSIQPYRHILPQDFHLAIIVKPRKHPSTANALPFTVRMEFDVQVEDEDDFSRMSSALVYDRGISGSRDERWYGASRHIREHTTPLLVDPSMPPHFSGSGQRVRRFLQPNGRAPELGEGMDDALLAIVGIVNDYSYSTFDDDTADLLRSHSSDLKGTATPNASFLDALLQPNEHILRLAKIRAHIASECQVSELLDTSDHTPIGPKRCRDLLRRVTRSLHLLQKAGLAQTSLILLADDPTRKGVIQSIELGIRDLEDVQKEWVDGTEYERMAPPKMLLQNAQQLLEKLGFRSTSLVKSQDRQLATYCIVVAMATASYAGSHCYPIGSGLDLATEEYKTFGSELCIRPCRFACLHRYIGGPVWVFSPGTSPGQRLRHDMMLSITPEQFDDLWGPLIKHEKDSEAIAIQTEGGLLYKVANDQAVRGYHKRDDETLMHWIPAQMSSTGILLDESECSSGFLPLPFDSKTTMLIGHNEQQRDAPSSRVRSQARSFTINRHCPLDVPQYQASLKASQLVYLNTSKKVWYLDTKATNLTVGHSGSSLGQVKTQKLRPATTWKTSILLRCAMPGQDIEPIMALRVGLEWSICTGNSQRITLRDALLLAFPRSVEDVEHLLHSVQDDDRARTRFMNYLNDLSQSGLDETKRLRLFWPWSEHTVLRLNSDDQPQWTKMLQDEQINCCFAVTVNKCLEYSGDVSRYCGFLGTRRKSKAVASKGPLLSTSISLYRNPTMSLPLEPAGILKMEAGCLTIVGRHRDGRARLAKFWVPNALDKTNELLDASDGERFGARTHAEFLDRGRDTKLSVDVCIMDRSEEGMIMKIAKAFIPAGWLDFF